MFKLGDKVVLSATGRDTYTDDSYNPHWQVGTVIPEISAGWIRVEWADGCKNAYRHSKLEIEKTITVGTRVTLSLAGLRLYSHQSGSGAMGTVTRVGEWHDVKWDIGGGNNYKTEHLEIQKPMKEKDMSVKEKTYIDTEGDEFEVDTATSTEFVYFTTSEGGGDEGQIVRLRAEDVKKIRKQLAKWLDNNGHRA